MTTFNSGVLGVFLLMLAGGAQAVTLDVCPSTCTYATIQDAVAVAAPGDVIDIGAGTYAGDLDIDIEDLTFQGAGAGVTFVEGLGFAAFIFREAAQNAVVSDMTLTSPWSMSCLYNYGASVILRDSVVEHCSANIVFGPYYAGGALYTLGDLTLERVTAQNNSAPEGLGGALYARWDPALPAPVVRIFDSEFIGNSAWSGGAVYIDTDVTAFIDGTDFLDNTADGTTVLNNYEGRGGAIYSAGALTITDSRLDGNFADGSGGGLAVTGNQDTKIANSVFFDNATTFLFASPPWFTGGGLFVESSGKVTVTGTLFDSNTARTGGAIGSYNLVTGGDISIRSSSLVSNTALYGGGAFALGGGPMIIRRSTIYGNTATAFGGGGGVAAALASTIDIRSSTVTGNISEASGGGVFDYGGELRARNSILAENTAAVAGAGGSTDDGSGFLYSDDFNVIGTIDGCAVTVAPDDLVGTDPLPLVAVLAPLADNGGPTQSMLPGALSPALDSGSGCAVRDQRGLLRPADGGLGVVQCDRGAVEVNATCIGPGPVNNMAPAAGAVVDPGQPLFTWIPAKDALTYDVRLIQFTPPFNISIIAAASGLTATNWRPDVSLVSGQTYYWRVIAHSHCGGQTNGTLTTFSVL